MSAKSVASTSSSSSGGSVFGLFGKKGKDIPKQPTVVISLNGSTLSGLPQSQPPSADTGRAGSRVTMQQRHDMLSEFFGGHQEQPLNETSSLPSYTSRAPDLEALPEYEEEYPTLARDLFKCGFFFPFLWLIGMMTLCIPLKPLPEWSNTKSEEEQMRILDKMRQAELKWAKRCLYAWSAFLAIVALVVIIIWVALRHH